METFLDLLFVVGAALAVLSCAVLALLFLVRRESVRRWALYAAAALGLYLGYVGFRINRFVSPAQSILALVLAGVGIGAVALTLLPRSTQRQHQSARLMAAVSLIAGPANASL